MITIRDREIPVDVERELGEFDWKMKSIKGDKLLACSPFRDERRPSFAVRLDNGVWIDSGSVDDHWRKGSLVQLLSFFRRETHEETEDYLLSVYDPFIANVDELLLDFDLGAPSAVNVPIVLEASILYPFKFRHPYLGRRGISEEVQRLFQIGYDRETKGVSLPWFDRHGRLINIKFRSVIDKKFWYMTGGDKIARHVYGLDLVVSRRIRSVYVTESETDALYLWTHGLPAVALGGAHLSERQRDLLLSAGIEELLIATDNDPAGDRVASLLLDEMSGYMQAERIQLPDGVKDVNEIPGDRLLESMKKSDSLSFV